MDARIKDILNDYLYRTPLEKLEDSIARIRKACAMMAEAKKTGGSNGND